MPKPEGKSTVPGATNRNGQQVLRRTGLNGNDHNQKVYVVRCTRFAREYGANGSDLWQRRCPSCDEGAPGLSYE
jgi:hypothetical protein